LGIVSFSPWNLQQINSPAGHQAGVTDSPAAAGDPFACGFGSRQHIGFLDAAGTIHDCWYDGARGRWNRQQVNGPGSVTSGPLAAGGPFIWTVGSEQLHFTYRSADGGIYDSCYTAGRRSLQRINGPDGLTNGPAASGNPFASVFDDQHHIGYLDAAGIVHDCWHEDGRWHLQQVNGAAGRTKGAPAAGGPFIWTAGSQQHHFTYYDASGTIHDSWFANGKWHLQHINGAGGLTDGPATAGLPFVSAHGEQQHVFYVGRTAFLVPIADEEGIIHDAWFDGAKDRWNIQQINSDGGLTAGPAAAGGPSVSVFSPRALPALAGQHVAYRDGAGTIYDAWFDTLASSWNLQQVTGAGGAAGGPAAAGDPCAWTTAASQQHFTYRTAEGAIYDAWFNGAAAG
jgi:hypothetical protein